ncbi:MAG: caspase family protein, partial [Holophagales bacterium]|nr:caspase family protein [Holophagales bacterium]
MPDNRFSRILGLALVAMLAAPASAVAQAPPPHRALVVGIDRYAGPGADPEVLRKRGLRDLEGAVRDAKTMAAVLEQRGYAVRVLLDQQATRSGISTALEQFLEQPARPGDDLIFYFAGHGSRVRSDDPEEPEGYDETLVLADAGAGVPDLLDDELRRRLGRLLDRGARLTVVLDSCYSGSAARGVPGRGRLRSAEPLALPSDPRKGRRQPPRLEDRTAALILAAAQETQQARETVGSDGEARGVFTYALLRALGDARHGENAATTFRRAAGRIAADAENQRPVLAGALERQREPLFTPPFVRALGQVWDTRSDSAVLLSDDGGNVVVEGGWARGLRPGDELRAEDTVVRLEDVDPVKSRGLRQRGPALEAGTVLVRSRLGPPPEPDLTVWMPEALFGRRQLLALDRQIARILSARGIERVTDPWQSAPTHVLRYREPPGWELVARDPVGGESRAMALNLGPSVEELERSFRALPEGARVFVQLPLPRQPGLE